MGKKEKKDTKPPPSDVFDPLSVESQQAATCVLMLNSPEEDVLAKACEALYKFVEKGEENKKTLLDLGAIDQLLRLIQHDDRIVRRNACMAFGLMTSHPDVRKMLRKREETVPRIISLLAPEEDTLCHEFSAMALSNLSVDYAAKVAILEHEGLESLIRGMTESDPDVQKNSVEAICLLLLDFSARSSIRELGGIAPLLDLIKSEYPVIQELSLVALERVTLDIDNRVALREMDGLAHLVSFIGNPENNTLHVFAVHVLANCLEDTESVEMIKESGGLKKLVAYITDIPPPEDESGGKKTAGKDGKKKDKSGKPKSGKGKEDKSKAAKPDDGELVPTLPDVKQFAAKALGRAARSVENKKVLHEAEVEKMFIHLFAHEDVKVQAAAVEALGIMAEFGLSRDSISTWEGMEPLVRMLKKEDMYDLVEAATLAIGNLTNGSQHNVHDVMNFGGLESLISLLGHPVDTIISNTCVILANMSTEVDVREEIEKQGVIQALIGPMNSGNTKVQDKSALAVASFLIDADCRAEIRNLNGLEPLVKMLNSGDGAVSRNASWALSVAAVDEPTAMAIATLGGIETLQAIQLSESRKNAFTNSALEALLNHNLSAKYALTGALGYNNMIVNGFYDCGRLAKGTPISPIKHILEADDTLFKHVDADRALRSMHNLVTDGFYDAGAIRPTANFQPLEALCKKELDQKRPVFLVNPAPEGVKKIRNSTSKKIQFKEPKEIKERYGSTRPTVPIEAVKEEKNTKGGKSGRDSKSPELRKLASPEMRKPTSKSRGRKERDEEKEREEEQRLRELEEAAQREQQFTIPPDPQLLKYIEEVNEKILPLPTCREQIVKLAEFVSSKMGGPIARGEIGNFSWELPMMQLKYERKSNVIPIGFIKSGIHIHRALLYKVLADRIGVGCTLERGEYHRAWNHVLLFDSTENGELKFPPKDYVVDLIHDVGSLIPCDSPNAELYKTLPNNKDDLLTFLK